MKAGTRFDAWVRSGPFTTQDLGRFRVVFAVVTLLVVPPFRWVAQFPDAAFVPPPGPFDLLGGFPPEPVLLALEVALAGALGALALGWRTTAASVSTAALLLVGFGFSYSLGKIDHTIFLVVTPLVLAAARWGDAVSVDALRRRDRGTEVPSPQEQWPLRLLALLLGLAFVTAAVPKVLAGWLDPATSAVRGVLFSNYYVEQRQDLLAPLVLRLDVGWLWEAQDWATVLLEALLVLAVASWRVWRTSLAVVALFHVGILLVMGIAFGVNVLVYGAFLSWGRLRLPRPPAVLVRRRRTLVRLAPVAAALLGLAGWALPWPEPATWRALVVGVGGVVAGAYLLRQVLGVADRARRRPGHSGTLERPGVSVPAEQA